MKKCHSIACIYAQTSEIMWELERQLEWLDVRSGFEARVWTFLAERCFSLVLLERETIRISDAQCYCMAKRLEVMRPIESLSVNLTKFTGIGARLASGENAAVTEECKEEANELMSTMKKVILTSSYQSNAFCCPLDELVACLSVAGETLSSYCPQFLDLLLKHISDEIASVDVFEWKGRVVHSAVCLTHLIMGVDKYYSGLSPPSLTHAQRTKFDDLCSVFLVAKRPRIFLHQDYVMEAGLGKLILSRGFSLSELEQEYLVSITHATRKYIKSWSGWLHGSSLNILYKIFHIHKKRALFEHVRFNF